MIGRPPSILHSSSFARFDCAKMERLVRRASLYAHSDSLGTIDPACHLTIMSVPRGAKMLITDSCLDTKIYQARTITATHSGIQPKTWVPSRLVRMCDVSIGEMLARLSSVDRSTSCARPTRGEETSNKQSVHDKPFANLSLARFVARLSLRSCSWLRNRPHPSSHETHVVPA